VFTFPEDQVKNSISIKMVRLAEMFAQFGSYCETTSQHYC